MSFDFYAPGHRILIKADVAVEQDEAFLAAKRIGLEIAKSTITQQQTGVDRGVVVDVGPTAFDAFGGDKWCKVGDYIIFAKHAGKVIEHEDEFYVAINDEDVVLVKKEAV